MVVIITESETLLKVQPTGFEFIRTPEISYRFEIPDICRQGRYSRDSYETDYFLDTIDGSNDEGRRRTVTACAYAHEVRFESTRHEFTCRCDTWPMGM